MTERKTRSQDTTPAHCSRCDALCCRLKVTVFPEDKVAPHLTMLDDSQVLMMARDEEGWCVALDGASMRCSIYESRPAVCRKFAMDGPYCRSLRADDSERRARGIELILHPQDA